MSSDKVKNTVNSKENICREKLIKNMSQQFKEEFMINLSDNLKQREELTFNLFMRVSDEPSHSSADIFHYIECIFRQ